MKNFNIFVMVLVLMVLMVLAPACKRADGNDDVKNFADVVSIKIWQDSYPGLVDLYISDITLRYVNKNSGYEKGNMIIDWGDGEVRDYGIDLPSTNGAEVTLNIWPGISDSNRYRFIGEKTVTLKITINFMGYTSVFTKTEVLKTQ
jgi:hypothetical protein